MTTTFRCWDADDEDGKDAVEIEVNEVDAIWSVGEGQGPIMQSLAAQRWAVREAGRRFDEVPDEMRTSFDVWVEGPDAHREHFAVDVRVTFNAYAQKSKPRLGASL